MRADSRTARGSRQGLLVLAMLSLGSMALGPQDVVPHIHQRGHHRLGPEAGLGQDLAHRVDRAIWRVMDRDHLVGVAIAVIRDRRIVYERGYGFADREECVPVTEHTRFRWASLCKPLTAVAALQLWEQGRLDLDADVRPLVPEFPDKGEPITARQLLAHQAGITARAHVPPDLLRDWRDGTRPEPASDLIQSLATFADTPLIGRPTLQYCYSTPGYILLGAVIQRAGGAPYLEQVHQRILDPLGMITFEPDVGWRPCRHHAVGYFGDPNDPTRILRRDPTDVSWKLSAGGAVSTIDDLARFAEALLDQRLLSPETSALMWTPERDALGRPTGYGLGFQVDVDIQGRRRVWHAGAQEGTRTRLVLYPEQGLGIAVLTNSEHADSQRLTNAVEKALSAASRNGD